jgi:hypothetical protein
VRSYWQTQYPHQPRGGQLHNHPHQNTNNSFQKISKSRQMVGDSGRPREEPQKLERRRPRGSAEAVALAPSPARSGAAEESAGRAEFPGWDPVLNDEHRSRGAASGFPQLRKQWRPLEITRVNRSGLSLHRRRSGSFQQLRATSAWPDPGSSPQLGAR